MSVTAADPGAVTMVTKTEVITESRTMPRANSPLREAEPASIIFRPLDAKFWDGKQTIVPIQPYFKFKIGWKKQKSQPASAVGLHSFWNSAIEMERKKGECFAKLKCKDKEKNVFKSSLGSCKIDLDQLAMKKKVKEWFFLRKGENKTVGMVLLDIEYLDLSKQSVSIKNSAVP